MKGSGVSAVTAYTAHREWAHRPPDERYASIQALHDAARARRRRIEERTTDAEYLHVEAVNAESLVVRDESDQMSALTHRSVEQLASSAGAPPIPRTLPAPIASDAINDGLDRQRREQHKLLADRDAPWTGQLKAPRVLFRSTDQPLVRLRPARRDPSDMRPNISSRSSLSLRTTGFRRYAGLACAGLPVGGEEDWRPMRDTFDRCKSAASNR